MYNVVDSVNKMYVGIWLDISGLIRCIMIGVGECFSTFNVNRGMLWRVYGIRKNMDHNNNSIKLGKTFNKHILHQRSKNQEFKLGKNLLTLRKSQSLLHLIWLIDAIKNKKIIIIILLHLSIKRVIMILLILRKIWNISMDE